MTDTIKRRDYRRSPACGQCGRRYPHSHPQQPKKENSKMTQNIHPDTIEGHAPRQAPEFGSEDPCECGAGCKGYGASKTRRIRSERDVVAMNIRRFGGMLYFGGLDEGGSAITLVSKVITSLEAYDRIEADDGRTDYEARAKRAAKEANPDHAEAVEYAKHYVGNFDFMQQMRLKVEEPRFRGFSDNQVAAILKCSARQQEWAKKAAEQTGVDLRAVVPEGSWLVAVKNDSAGVSFFKVDHVASGKWAGWVFVKQQQGPNMDAMKVGSQKPEQMYSGKWVNLMERIAADFKAALLLYGTELGICGACASPLTNDESRAKGIGPICASKGRWE
jgi:hypothetical protein